MHDLGGLARVGVTERAAPDAARTHEYHVGVRRSLQDFGGRSRGADHFRAVALGPSRRPENEVFALGQTVDHFLHRLLDALPRVRTGLLQVGDPHRPEQHHEGIEQGVEEIALQQHGTGHRAGVDKGEYDPRVDETWVIGKNEGRSFEAVQFLDPFDANPIP